MSSDSLQAMSQDELRKKLYQTFKDRGVLDSLKTQLRNQLIRELKHPFSKGAPHPQSEVLKDDSLLFRASNSLVADHLRSAGYDYTLSVFYPECGLEKERAFTTQDLLQLMNVKQKSKLYKSLQTSDIHQLNRTGILLHVLTELTEYHLQKERCDADTQTVSTPPYKESVVEKLQLIDEQFADFNPPRQKFESLEGKLAIYRKEIEHQLQKEMSQQLKYFRDTEIAKIRLEEKEKSRKEMTELRQELEKTYQTKSEGLVARERNAIERLQKHQEIEAKEGYAQRQNLLKDIEMVRSREAHLKQQMEAFELSEKLQGEKNRSADDSLRRRELAVKNLEDTFDQKLKNELLKYQIELKEDYMKRTCKVTEDEKRNKEESLRLREEAIFIHSKKEELEYGAAHAKELEMELNSVKSQLSLVNRQNHELIEQQKETMDNPHLKEEKLNLQTHIRCLQDQLEQIKSEKILFPTTEELTLQAQIQRVENARKMDQDEFKAREEILEKQLQREVLLCAELKIQLLNSEETNRRVTAQMEDLKLQLQQTQQALENEVYRNPKPSLVDRSVLEFSANRIVPHDIYVDGAVYKSQTLSYPFVEANGVESTRFQQHNLRRSSSPDSDIQFVATTKARIKELEKEADYLEEAYRNYQKRIICAAGKSSPQAKVTSPKLLRGVHSKEPSTTPPKVTFVEDAFASKRPLARSTGRRENSLFAFDGIQMLNSTPLQKKTASSSHLFSTPFSKVLTSNNAFSEDLNGSYTAASRHSPEHPLSPIPGPGGLPSTASMSPSQTPLDDGQTLSNPHEADCREINNSPVPPKLVLEELEESHVSHQSREGISEQLEGDGSHPSEAIDNGNPVTATLHASATSQDGMMDQIQDEKQAMEDEDTKWEEEIRDREERRQRERRDTFERGQKELEELKKEKSLKEDFSGTEGKKEDIESEKSDKNVHIHQDPSTDPIANPLEKYMQIILQKREQELADKNFRKEILEDVSLTDRLSDEKDDSIAPISRGETDEDFW